MMATGSRAQAAERLKAAKYFTGQSSANSAPRCSNCTHVQPLEGGKQHGRYCGHLRAAVKTHGCCQLHQAAPV